MKRFLNNDYVGKPKATRYHAKSMAGEDVEIMDINDDNGFYTSWLLSVKDKHTGRVHRTEAYQSERVVKPASSIHGHDITGINRPKFGMERTSSIGASFHHSTGHLMDL